MDRRAPHRETGRRAPADPARRRLVAGIAAAAAMPELARAQASERRYRLCWLASATTRQEVYAIAFTDRLRELGFDEGRNLTIEFRNAEGRVDRLPALAAELVRTRCDVVFAPGTEIALTAAKRASADLPIVIVANDYDPVSTGHIPSLARPGGRITGVTPLQSELPAKRLETLKLMLPAAKKVAVLADVSTVSQVVSVRDAARRLGVALQLHELRDPPYDYDAAFEAIARARPDALFALTSGIFAASRAKITGLALRHGLPSIFTHSIWVDAGGLASYGLNFSDLYRRAADKVGRILNGAKPADLPVEQPTSIEFAINLRTAKALGIAIPPSVALRATYVVE